MEPVHIETYKGSQIRIFVWPDTGNGGHVVMYEIHVSATRTKGGFVISPVAKEAALETARQWIDDNT